MCTFGYSLPLFAFILCITLTIINDFQKANETHCNVPNYLPSISASTSASFYPQSIIWRSCMALDALPRYLLAYIHYKEYYMSDYLNLNLIKFNYRNVYLILVKILFLSHLIELTSLLSLSFISSDDNFTLHSLSFISFVLFSLIYMSLSICAYFFRNSKSKKYHESRNRKLKTFLIYITSLLFSTYFYIRHNTYCEPFIYSLFSLCEYSIVISNIYFHHLIVYDLKLLNSSSINSNLSFVFQTTNQKKEKNHLN